MVRMCLKRLGLKGNRFLLAGDGVNNNTSKAWHCAFYKLRFTEEEKSQVAESFEHFRKKLDLGSSKIFFVEEVFDADRYLRKHNCVIEWCR